MARHSQDNELARSLGPKREDTLSPGLQVAFYSPTSSHGFAARLCVCSQADTIIIITITIIIMIMKMIMIIILITI